MSNDSTPAAEPQEPARLDLIGSGLTSRYSGQAVNECPTADVSEDQARAWMRAHEERAQRKLRIALDNLAAFGFPGLPT